MDSLRRTLVLGLPLIAVGGLHGCGGAEGSSTQEKATAQSVDRSTAQAESNTSNGGNFSIRNRSGGNFPVVDGSFDMSPQSRLIQAVINTGSPLGAGIPILALQLSTTRTSGADTLIAELSLSVKLGDSIPSAASTYSLGSGGALASDALITCRQISSDGSVKSYAYRMVAGVFSVSDINLANGTATVSLRDVIVNVAVGFNNLAQGTIALQTNSPATVRIALENSGPQLS